MPPRNGRPLVVLAGWLGCQPRSLRRYQALYQNLGLDVEMRIATPAMIVEASRASPFLPKDDAPADSIQHLAWEVHDLTQASPCWFFHAFSNGGCFVWEQVRMILEKKETGTTNYRPPVGVVFDSAPANYQGNNSLSKALSYCTWSEQARIHLQEFLGGAATKRQRLERATAFWDALRDGGESNVRQLYLCSHDDELTSFEDLKELVQRRQRRVGSHGRIWMKDWKSSPHCTHLLQHPDDYQKAVSEFVDICLHDRKAVVRSKL